MKPGDFAEWLERYPRIAIAGGPRMGKSTLAGTVTGRPVLWSRDYESQGWSQSSAKMVVDARPLPSFVVEGVQVARALRKGLEVDAVVYMTRPKVARLPGQVAMAKAVLTVFREWRHANPHVPLLIE